MRCACFAIVLAVVVSPKSVFAQEDLEPRVIAEKGTTTIGVSGFLDQFASPESTFPTQVTLHLDVSRFVTSRIAARGGLIGTAVLGGDEDDVATGPGTAALDALGSVLYYFTPQSMASFFAGLEYRAPLTARAERDAGTALGLGGVQAALSSRSAVFVQGGYGVRLTRGDEGEWQRRLTGEIGFRIKF